jgi:hypothetical protein
MQTMLLLLSHCSADASQVFLFPVNPLTSSNSYFSTTPGRHRRRSLTAQTTEADAITVQPSISRALISR